MPRRTIIALLLGTLVSGCWGTSTGLEGETDATADTTTPDLPADTASDTAHHDVDPDTVSPPTVEYALHEWGVFVFGGGTAGASVHGPSPEVAETSLDKPVIYIYSDEEFVLDLTVDLVGGEVTEVWPTTSTGTHVSWNDVLVSPGSCDATPFPSIWEEPWVYDYCEACTLGTCVVPDAACLSTADQVAKLLFYAGDMPTMTAPLSATVSMVPGDASVTVDVLNHSERTVQDIWVLYRDTTSVCEYYEYCPVATADLAVGRIESLEPGRGILSVLDTVHLEAELDESGVPIAGTLGSSEQWESVPQEVALALQTLGLTGQEADAFIAAWHVAMFGIMGDDATYLEPYYRNGVSLLYFMDRASYDDALPLTVSPTPTELARVGLIYQHL